MGVCDVVLRHAVLPSAALWPVTFVLHCAVVCHGVVCCVVSRCVAPDCVVGNCVVSHLRRFKQASTVDCFDDIVLFVPLLAPAGSCCSSGFLNINVLLK